MTFSTEFLAPATRTVPSSGPDCWTRITGSPSDRESTEEDGGDKGGVATTSVCCPVARTSRQPTQTGTRAAARPTPKRTVDRP